MDQLILQKGGKTPWYPKRTSLAAVSAACLGASFFRVGLDWRRPIG